MGGHGQEHPKIPDYRIYRVEDVPQLMKLKKKLAQQGLSDPWLRNEVWKFTEETNKYSPWYRISGVMKQGMKYGLVAAIISSAVELAFFPIRKAPSYGDESKHH